MIIRNPTGFFNAVLPQSSGTRSNVTYIVSSSTPPRTNLVFPKAVRGIIDRKRSPNTNSFGRRTTKGDLVFTVTKSTRSDGGNNAKLYELGQILEFGQVETRTIDQMPVGPVSEIRHNVNQFDYDQLSLTQADVEVINEQSYLAQQTVATQLNIIRQARKNAETEVNSQQKIINEADRNIAAIDAIIASGEDQPELAIIRNKLVERRDLAFLARDRASKSANDLAVQATDLANQLRAISIMVK
jgi:hypothetical protein